MDISKPVPKKNELLVRVHASTVSAGVIWLRKGKYPNSKFISFMLRLYFGISKPRVNMLGIEYAGVVESTGSDVHTFKRGDKVFGTTTGLYNGTYAEYICVPERGSQNVIGKFPHQVSPIILHAKGKMCSVNSIVSEKLSYLNQLLNMIDEQKLTIVIDRTYTFSQMVEAHEYVEKGHKRGNVVICQ